MEAENPYWTRNGAITVEDPDRWRVVLMPQPFAGGTEPPPGSEADGIPLRDRVWPGIELGST